MNIRLTLLTAAAALSLLVSAQPALAGQDLGACAPGAVRLEHAYSRPAGNAVVGAVAHGLGTAVSPHVVLTHNHFVRRPEPGRGETLTIVECSGKTTRLAVDQLAFVAVDAGTALIFLPTSVSLASASVAGQTVAVGNRLNVSYWEDSAGRFAQKEFAVLKVKNGVATLADPERVINPGDSGGGVFLNGAVVADTWAIYTDAQGQPTGKFDVALLPAEARRLLAEETPAAGGAQ